MSWHDLLIQALLIGLANGAVIALIALGYTLVYGIIELINFAHGDVFMLGTMGALTLVQFFGLKRSMDGLRLTLLLLLVLLAAMVFSAAINMLVERIAYRPLRQAPRLAPLISAIGVSFILVNLGLFWKGASPVDFPNLIPTIDILNDVLHLNTQVFFTTKDVFVLGMTIPLMVGLHFFIQRTRLGKAMRATAQDREAAALMGININATIALTFLIGGSLAGAAGFISGVYNNSAWFFMGFRGGLMAFTAAVIGGIGNVAGAVLGGLLIGLLAAISDSYVDAKWTPVVVFGLLIITLVFKPSGLMGEQLPERG